MIDIHQVTVEIEMTVSAHLYGGIRGLSGYGAWRKVELSIDGKWRPFYLGQAFGGKSFLVDDDLLDGGVRGLLPMRIEGGHFRIGRYCIVGRMRSESCDY